MLDVILGETHCLLDVGRRDAFLRVSGHWKGENALKFGRLFTRFLTPIREKLVLNLEGCRSMDAQGLSVLVRLQDQLAAQGKRIELLSVPERLLPLLEGTRLIPAPELSGTAIIER